MRLYSVRKKKLFTSDFCQRFRGIELLVGGWQCKYRRSEATEEVVLWPKPWLIDLDVPATFALPSYSSNDASFTLNHYRAFHNRGQLLPVPIVPPSSPVFSLAEAELPCIYAGSSFTAGYAPVFSGRLWFCNRWSLTLSWSMGINIAAAPACNTIGTSIGGTVTIHNVTESQVFEAHPFASTWMTNVALCGTSFNCNVYSGDLVTESGTIRILE